MHSSLAVTVDGLPLGLTAIKFWTRDEFHGCNALKKKIDPTRVPIERKESIRWLENLRQSTALLNDPQRCIHIGDRESDIYECSVPHSRWARIFWYAPVWTASPETVQLRSPRRSRQVRVQGLYRIEVRDKEGAVSEAVLEIRFCRTVVLPPIGKQKNYPKLILTVMHAQERGTPHGRDRIDWNYSPTCPLVARKEAVRR